MRLRRLVDRVARALYRDELRRGGSAVDIGFIGSALFRSDARRAVQDAIGALWTIEPPISNRRGIERETRKGSNATP